MLTNNNNIDDKMYSLYKCKKILRYVYDLYNKKKKTLSEIQKKRFENILISLQSSILKKNVKAADTAAKNLEKLANSNLKKTFFEKSINFVFSLIFAILVAIVVRQMWFEFYTIPTGSMRPELKEKDFLMVSKTNFSINIPISPITQKHFYFDPNLLHRGSIVTFSSANLDMPDTNMMYFYVFPGKKQLVKRLIGKPGDTLYFYGGRIYGIDKNDNEINELWDSIWFKSIEHIPFIRFDGKAITNTSFSKDANSSVVFYQMNEPIAMLNVNSFGQIEGNILTDHSSIFTKDSKINNYFDVFGFNNFAMARILSKDDIGNYSTASIDGIENAPLYLELIHHPSLKNAKIIRDEMGRLRPGLSYEKSIIALNEDILKKIFNSIYTARFIVKNGYIYRLGSSYINDPKYLVKLDDVEDGCYEIQDGEAYRVNFLGITTKLNKDHPLNTFSIEKTKTFFNLGIEFLKVFNPSKKNQHLIPSRYAYFRDKDLYLMGHLIFKNDDPALSNFLQREYKKQSMTSDYYPFDDEGSPIDKNGNLDKEKIKKYGLKVPEKMYLMLGDNHAMSADSREFGFVPEDNLKGGVNFIFWPPSKRWGFPFQPEWGFLILPKIIIWFIAGLIILISILYYNSKIKRPMKF